ncbi:MAG: adenylate/guanylate cyclase domain-containing protein [Alphaproteobacteria bacterium]|nr:adenylate/guanylate cyclase domain-containing protein [Alphaproteobacteria bacterium]
MAHPVTTLADQQTQNPPDALTRLEHRTESAFADEERQGLMLAAKTRTIALLVILLWQIFDNPESGLAYVYDLASVASFAVLGLLQFTCARQRFHMGVLKYVFVAVDCALLALLLAAENPFSDLAVPPAFAMHGSPFTFFFVFLMQAAFSLRPRLVLWCGLCIVLARSGMLLWVVGQPGVVTNLDLPDLTLPSLIAAASNPNFVFLGHWAIEVIVALIVAAGLAVVVARSRQLVETRSMAERARASLARYFSPNVVDRLSGTQDWLGTVKEQNAAVLFADIVGFTRLCERETPDGVIALLRDYHDRLGRAVFDNGGTLDKYIGDGLMATFGTPAPHPEDARNALHCALDMVSALETWNAERTASGAQPVRVGIGLHYGPVIAGDIGNERRLEYSVIGDTVNIASRLEQLTRRLHSPLVVSDQLVQAVRANDQDPGRLLARLTEAGGQEIRGREGDVPVWVLKGEDNQQS